jgi:hypothetical protein
MENRNLMRQWSRIPAAPFSMPHGSCVKPDDRLLTLSRRSLGVGGSPITNYYFFQRGVGRIRGVGRGLGVTLGVAVGDGVGVCDALGVAVGVGVGVAVDVGVGVGVIGGVVVGVGVAHGSGAHPAP